jgi:hypothetical protein
MITAAVTDRPKLLANTQSPYGQRIQPTGKGLMEVHGPASTVSNNSGWGLYCSPAPAVAQCALQCGGVWITDGSTKGPISRVETPR